MFEVVIGNMVMEGEKEDSEGSEENEDKEG